MAGKLREPRRNIRPAGESCTSMARSAKRLSVSRFADDLKATFSKNRMVIFLCGPTLTADRASAVLRSRIQRELEEDGFEVVLGEDDGLERLRREFKGIYAHENELNFIKKECGAIVLVADSVGSFCELGLFAHVHTHENTNSRDFILIIDRKFEADVSYLNEGPARAIRDFGIVFYEDFATFDTDKLIKRLQGRRAVYFFDGRGRPAKAA